MHEGCDQTGASQRTADGWIEIPAWLGSQMPLTAIDWRHEDAIAKHYLRLSANTRRESGWQKRSNKTLSR